MGRWAGAQRSGGGPQLPNHMISAVDISGTEISITYAGPVSVSTFDLADFTSNPSAQTPFDKQQNGTRGITIEFTLSIAADTTLVYSDPRQGFLTPQTINH